MYKELRENEVCFVRINSSDVLAPKFYPVSELMRDEDLGGLTCFFLRGFQHRHGAIKAFL